LVAESLKGVANGCGGDTEHDSQLVFDGQLLAAPQEPERNCTRQALHDCVGA
jgi:hypothetical protein